MRRISIFKRCLACIVAITLCTGVFSYTSHNKENTITVSAESEEAKKNNQEISNTEKNLEELKKQQKDIDKQINATQGDITKEEENQKAIQAQIDTVQKTILELEKSIKELNGQIDELQEDIDESRHKILEKQEEINKGTEEFKKRLRSMYVVGDDSYISLIAGSTDFYDMLMKSELVKRVARHDKEMIDKLISLKAQFEEEKRELEKKKSEIEGKKNKLVSQQNEVKKQVEKQQELMSKSKAAVKQLEEQKAAYKANQKNIEESNKKFQNNLQKLIKKRQEIATKEEQERIRKAEEEARKLQEASKNKVAGSSFHTPTYNQSSNNQSSGNKSTSNQKRAGKKLIWPVPGFNYIIFGFGYRISPGLTGFHNGIDITTAAGGVNIGGHDIVAAADGEVIDVCTSCSHDYGKTNGMPYCGCGGGYGNYCTILHADGMVTVYAHQRRVKVRVGQHVKAGETIGTVGTTGNSTGEHLHFEVQIGGLKVDPQLYV